MDTLLTVVFTGLMIFDSRGNVHLVDAPRHDKFAEIEGGASFRIEESVEFAGLASGPAPAAGFLPHLGGMFRHADQRQRLELENWSVRSLILAGGELTPGEEYANCTVLDGRPATFWMSVRWRVSVPDGAKLVVDGDARKTRALRNGMTVWISNRPSDRGGDHRSMYQIALKGAPKYYAPACVQLAAAIHARTAWWETPVSCPVMYLP